jgi:hypothetical protein
MRRFKVILILSILLIFFNSYTFTQNPSNKLITPHYLSGVWVIHHIDTVFSHKEELKIKFLGNGNFEQWLEVDGKISDVHKGIYKVKGNFLVFIDRKRRENVYRIIQVSLTSFKVREKSARDIITFARE